MKIKSFALLATAGLLVANIANAAPAMADDFGNGMPMEQTLADNTTTSVQPPADNSSGSMAQPPADNSIPEQNNAGSSGDMNNNTGTMAPSNPSNNEEGSPDTTTGDDDY